MNTTSKVWAAALLLGASLSHASWPVEGWMGPYKVKYANSQLTTTGDSYVLTFQTKTAVQSGSYCGDNGNPLRFYHLGQGLAGSLASVKSAQANVLAALASGLPIMVRFRGQDQCAIDNLAVCYEDADCLR